MSIPKPKKPLEDPKSYRPISLLCIPYKILERPIHARVGPIVDPLLPREQLGFRRGRSTVDQTVLLTQNIEDSFETKKKAGAVFVDLTAATLSGTVVSPASCLGFSRISTRFGSLWNFSGIEVSLSLLVTASKVG